MLYDYDNVVPMPLARMSGYLTRYGQVAPLLQADDDRLCLVGPGDEVRVDFDGTSVPGLALGWTRCYVLRTVGYCKDADLFTATGDTVGPLPCARDEILPVRSGGTASGRRGLPRLHQGLSNAPGGQCGKRQERLAPGGDPKPPRTR